MPQKRSSRAALPARLHRKVTLLYTMCPNYSRNVRVGTWPLSRGNARCRSPARGRGYGSSERRGCGAARAARRRARRRDVSCSAAAPRGAGCCAA
eukprot:3863964-Prymnesium_polylepis.1